MNNPIDEYEAILERIFSVYLDATEGIRYIARDAKVLVSPQTPKVRAKNAQSVSPPGYLIYGLGSPEDGNYMELCTRKAEVIIADNQDDGPKWDFIGRMAVVAAYQFWADHYREQIAKHIGISKDKLKIPIFGDLRRFRHCILHNGARWADELRKIECFE